MNRSLAWLALVLAACAAHAAVKAGENLLVNGTLAAEQSDAPEFWSVSPQANVVCQPAGGPQGRVPAVVVQAGVGLKDTISVRQQGLVLAPGETYKLSAWVKTKGFSSKHHGVIVHNSGWVKEAGVHNLPADSDWTLREETFTLFPSADREYGVALFAVAPKGELAVADVRLEAISEGALKGSSSQAALVTTPRLVPLKPLLNRIPRTQPALTLKLYGQLADGPQAYECLASVAGNPIAPQTVAPDGNTLVVKLAGLPVGDHRLELLVRNRQTQAELVRAAFPISIIDPPTIDRRGIRQLNNLVAEVLAEKLPAATTEQTCRFVSPRDGWVFLALETTRPGDRLAVAIDGGQPVITAATPRLEAFRELPAGEHRLTVTGNAAGGRLVVRAIPEIFDYPPGASSQVKENGSYDWAWMQRHVLQAVTTLNGGVLPGPALGEAKAMGLRWLANFNVAPTNDPVDVRKRMEANPGLTQPEYDGLTSDELFFGRTSIDNYTKALWSVNNPEQRRIYTWIVGKPAIAALHTDFMAACLNASHGRGRLLYEAYCHPQEDEATAAAYLSGFITDTMHQFKAYYPGAEAGTGIIFGNFNQIPIISLEHNPAVDFKYFLDMQVNLIANHPEFAGLATTGYWGTYYGDEELARWSFLLMRHYAVEGKKDMLSKQYGFTYRPGFVTNPDFAQGLDGWQAEPAAADSLKTATLPGFGRSSEGRWGGGTTGDTVCLMVRQPGKANRLTQRIRNLQVGKVYSLQFVTADRRDVVEQKHNPRRYGLEASLDGVQVLPERSFVHIDRRQSKSGSADAPGKINLHRIVFRATATEAMLAFSDETAKPGEELVLNFVQLKPYLE